MASRFHVVALVASLLAPALAIPALDPRAACNADLCLRQLRGGPSSASATAYCSSLIGVPVVTATASPVVVTVATTFTSYSTLAVTLNSHSAANKRDAAPEPTGIEQPKLEVRAPEPTAAPEKRDASLPPFANSCTSTGTTTSRIQSACACLSISTSTTTVTPTTTTTVGPTTTLAVCPGSPSQYVNLNGYSISNFESHNGGSELQLYPTSDPAVCCGACYSAQNCQTFEIDRGQCVLQFGYGDTITTNPQCPAGLGTAFSISYGTPGFAGFGPCLVITQ